MYVLGLDCLDVKLVFCCLGGVLGVVICGDCGVEYLCWMIIRRVCVFVSLLLGFSIMCLFNFCGVSFEWVVLSGLLILISLVSVFF